MKKIIFIFTLLIIILGINFYLYKKYSISRRNADNNLFSVENKDATQEAWKLYENKTLGLSLIYPDDWILENQNTKYGDQTNMDLIYRPSTTQDYPSKDKPMDAFINIGTLDNPKNLTLQEIFYNHHTECKKNIKKDGMGCLPVIDISEWKKYKLNEYDVYKTGYEPIAGEGGGLPGNTLYVCKDGYFIFISAMNYNLRNTYDPAPVFEKIISSIKIY